MTRDERNAEIRRLRSEGWKMAAIAAQFGITHSRVSQILSGEVKIGGATPPPYHPPYKLPSPGRTPRDLLPTLSELRTAHALWYAKKYGGRGSQSGPERR